MTTSSIQNLPASKAYGVRADELLALVKGLEADVTNSLVDAQAADWGQIGDLGRALELAQQLRDLLRSKAN
ncbi:MAG: hypothetical protein WCJ87_02975 [Burkholderiales bacterium]